MIECDLGNLNISKVRKISPEQIYVREYKEYFQSNSCNQHSISKPLIS